jgi:hypothetical protein
MATKEKTEKTETMDDTRKKLREIYSFTVEKEEKVKKTETKKVKNPDTKKMEEVSITREVTEGVPYRVILKEPTRRQIEDAELEYSVEMSKCIRKGILTKAMLAKKYSDTGGLLTEVDAKHLSGLYIKFGELSSDFQKVNSRLKKEDKDRDRLAKLSGEIAKAKKEIIDIETSYSSLFNHTADTRAQNKVIQWYILNLTHIQKSDADEVEPLFEGESLEDKEDRFYELEEGDDDLYNLVSGKVATIISFWYYSAGAVTREEIEKLDQDLESGEI